MQLRASSVGNVQDLRTRDGWMDDVCVSIRKLASRLWRRRSPCADPTLGHPLTHADGAFRFHWNRDSSLDHCPCTNSHIPVVDQAPHNPEAHRLACGVVCTREHTAGPLLGVAAMVQPHVYLTYFGGHMDTNNPFCWPCGWLHDLPTSVVSYW